MNSKYRLPKEPTISVKYIVLFLAVATGVAGAIIGIYAYNKFVPQYPLNINVADIKDKPSAEEIKTLVTKISQIAVLPKDELPDVLVVSDLTQLRANPFFANVNLKDDILIYKKAGKVILYNPTSNRIVNMGPYVAANESSSSAKLQPKLEATDSAKTNDSPNIEVNPSQ